MAESDIKILISAQDLASAKIQEVQKSLKQIKDLKVKVKVDTTSTSAIDGITKKLEGIGDAAKGGVTGVLSAFGGIGAAASAAVVAIGAVTAALAGAKKAFIDYNATMETTTIAFTTMLGSAQDAEAMMADLKKFAAETPFEFKDVAPAAQQLKAFGFAAKDIIPTLTAIGDASAGLGRGTEGLQHMAFVLGQIKTSGHLLGGDVMQLAQLGIPVKDILNKELGLTADELAEIGAQGIQSDKAIQALINGMEERFPNMMKAMNSTYTGMLSNISDDTGQILGKIGENIFSGAKDIISHVRDIADTALENVSTRGLKDIFDGMVDESTAEELRRLFEDLSTVFDYFGKIADNVGTVLSNLWDIIGGGSGVITALVTYWEVFTTVLLNTANIISAVAADVSDFLNFLITGFQTAVSGVADEVYAGLQGAADTFTGFFNGVLQGLAQFANSFLSTVGEWLSSAYNAISDFVSKALDALGGVGTVIRNIAGAIGGVVDGASEKLDQLKASITGVADKVSDVAANTHTAQALAGIQLIHGAGSVGSVEIPHYTGGNAATVSAPTMDGGGAGGSAGSSGGGAGGAGEAAARELERLAQHVQDIITDLNAKIAEDTGTTFEKGMAKLNADIAKIKKDLQEAADSGIDITEASAKLSEYEKLVKDKLVDSMKQAQESLRNETTLTLAKISGDWQAEAEAEYNISLAKLEKEKENRLKEIAENENDAEAKLAIDQWYNANVQLLDQQRAENARRYATSWGDAWQNAMQNIMKKWGSVGEQMQNMADNIADTMASGFSDMFTDVLIGDFDDIGDSFKNMLKSMLRSISKFIVQQALTSLFSRGQATIPGRASGGPVTAGRAYIVGENRPELFIPHENGTIANIATTQASAKAPDVEVIVNNNTGNELEAKKSTSMKDGRWLTQVILSTVNNGIAYNQEGIRDVIAGVR